MLKFEKVLKRFGLNSFALEEIDLQINDGEFIFITGPSGAGKTTILRLLLGDLKVDSGLITVDKWNLAKIKSSELPSLRKYIGIVFQDFRLLTDRTVFENVALALELRGLKPIEIEKKVKEVLELTSLTDKAHLFPIQLAGGEMQRACLARAIVGEPKLLLADEPTGSLDPKTAREILFLLLKINEMGTTVIMATHNAELVNSCKKRVISLNKGKIVKDQNEGKYEEII